MKFQDIDFRIFAKDNLHYETRFNSEDKTH